MKTLFWDLSMLIPLQIMLKSTTYNMYMYRWRENFLFTWIWNSIHKFLFTHSNMQRGEDKATAGTVWWFLKSCLEMVRNTWMNPRLNSREGTSNSYQAPSLRGSGKTKMLFSRMINSISQLLLLYGGTYGTIENILHQVDNTESYKNMCHVQRSS